MPPEERHSAEKVRVHAVLNYRKPSIHMITGDFEKAVQATKDLCEKYGDPLAASIYTGLVEVALTDGGGADD